MLNTINQAQDPRAVMREFASRFILDEGPEGAIYTHHLPIRTEDTTDEIYTALVSFEDGLLYVEDNRTREKTSVISDIQMNHYGNALAEGLAQIARFAPVKKKKKQKPVKAKAVKEEEKPATKPKAKKVQGKKKAAKQ